MDKDLIKLGKYLKQQIEDAKEEILTNMDARLDVIEDALSNYDEDESNDEEQDDDDDNEFSEFEDEDDEPTIEQEDEEQEDDDEEFDYSDDDLEPTKLPDDVEKEINKLSPEEKEIVMQPKIQIKKPRIIKNV